MEHFSHTHPLTFNDDFDNADHNILCCGCHGIISGSNYSCSKCGFFLHQRCAELPPLIAHPLHRPHPLSLLMAPPYSSGQGLCDLCGNSLDNLVYHCSLCNFDLDIECALQPCVAGTIAGSNEHQFIHLIKSISFICDACGLEGTQSPYMCLLCQLMVHKECISLPKSIRIRGHIHVITHFYFLQQDDESVKPCCICDDLVDINHGGYCCLDCNYIVHVHCARQDFIRVEEKNYSLDINSLSGLTLESGNNMVEEKDVIENEWLGHEHGLKIIDSCGEKTLCNGCMLPLNSPVYGCLECKLFLHKKCSESSTKIQHPLHQHPLKLLSKAPSLDGLFKCDACDQYCHGFCYHCVKCDFYLDLRCGAILGTLQHQGHGHLLHLFPRQRNYGCYCSACYRGKFTYFDCAECNFSLDYRCATLPNSAGHRFDENHPLMINYKCVSDESLEHYCEICELRIDPGSYIYDCAPWFYGCEDCEISTHPDCVLGRYPYIKFGGSYLYDIHPHPLTLVQRPLTFNKKKKHYPPCDFCAEPFIAGENIDDLYQDLALRCTKCDFMIHRMNSCYNRHVLGKE